MKSCLVAIAKYEGDYIREWVEYHLSLGFNHIIIGDNNDDNTENIQHILIDYIKDSKVTVVDIRDYNIRQIDFYEYTFENLVGRFDWVLFCDIDEFLYLNNHKTVNEYLSQKKFKNYDIIKLCWKMMTNNKYVIQIDKPVLERFTEEANPIKLDHTFKDREGNIHYCYMNNTAKSFYRTTAKCIPGTHCTEKYFEGIRYCNNNGEKIEYKEYWPDWSQYNEYVNHDDAYIKHFATKSLEEYVKYKMKRGWSCFKLPDLIDYVRKNQLNINNFEQINGKSKLYEQMYKELLVKYNI